MHLSFLTNISKLNSMPLTRRAADDMVPRCNYGDVECIKKSAEYILHTHKDGIPALNVPSLDPIALNDIKMENPGIVNISLLLSGGKMFGLSKSKVNYVK